MNYRCTNCDNNIDLPGVVNKLDECNCDYCQSPVDTRDYLYCDHCELYYIRLLDQCEYCHKDSSSPSMIRVSYTYVKSADEFNRAIRFIEAKNLLAVDTEGNSLDPFKNELLLVQIGDEEHVFLFDYKWYPKLSYMSFWEDTQKLFLMHNAKYDLKVLKHSLGIEVGNIFDTMIAERLLTCGIDRQNSLKAVSEKYLGLVMNKEVRDDFISMTLASFDKLLTKDLLDYSAQDVQALPKIYKMQRWLLEEEGLYKIAMVEFKVCKVICNMELRGIYVDTESWKKIVEQNLLKKQVIEDKIHNYLIDEGFSGGLLGEVQVNLNSTKDLLIAFNRLNIPLQSTGIEELISIDHPFTNLVQEYRKIEKQLNAFGEKFLELVNDETSRVHPSFNQIGADTGRFSCTKPNLQQIPATGDYRRCFCAPPGRKIVTCDYSQQELRLLASLSGDPKFIKFYEDGVDLHSATASMMFNIPIEEVDKNTHRKVAKTINFGLAYGQGAAKLGQTIGVTTEEAEKMIEKYFAQFSYIGKWLETAAQEAQTRGYSQTLLGRRRYYDIPHRFTAERTRIMAAIGRKGKNTPIQGSGVDMVKLALVRIDENLKKEKLDAFLINTVHDEIVVEASEQDAQKALEVVRSAMEEAGREIAPNVPILAEGGVDDYWTH